MKKVFIIAEIGVNHNGSMELAKRLIDEAVEAGCDAVKFQSYKAENLVTPDAPKAKYQMKGAAASESQYSMLKKLELSPGDHKVLMDHCRKKKVEFMSTPFDEQSVDFLDKLGMRTFKISSGEITDRPLVSKIAAKKKPIILSTGMTDLGEIKTALGWIRREWKGMKKKPSLTLLHCVSNYPARIEDMNLSAIKTLRSVFGLPVGLSDHTLVTELSIASVALGAEVVERHFTLDRKMKGPDHKASLEPAQFRHMSEAIRNVEKALGDGIKRPASNEAEIKIMARKSIVAARDISAGEVLKAKDMVFKRPGTGIPPEQAYRLLNRTAIEDISKDTLIEEKSFSKRGRKKI